MAILSPKASAVSTITIHTDSTVTSDFIGYGTNHFPFALMQENLNQGYNEAFLEVEKARMNRMGLKVIRLWFQSDWFMTDWGVYDWEKPRIKAFFKWMDAAKSANVNIMINFGWKTSRDAQSWFSFPFTGEMPEISAPNVL